MMEATLQSLAVHLITETGRRRRSWFVKIIPPFGGAAADWGSKRRWAPTERPVTGNGRNYCTLRLSRLEERSWSCPLGGLEPQ
jgi:hypothetical protein